MFDKAFERVIGHEGGYTTDPKDRGNWTTGIIGKGECKGTKYGISAASYPNLDIKNLAEVQAKDIYHKDYWQAISLDKLYPAMAFQVFDAAINHGKTAAIKLLQKAVGTKQDGIIGPATLAAANSLTSPEAIYKFNAARIELYTSISTFQTYGRGWMARIANNLRYAAEDK